MHTAILHIGSNLGDRSHNLLQAREKITARIGQILKVSRVYETEAWGLTDQDYFLNQALLVNTDLNPAVLLRTCQEIEEEGFRERNMKWGPRTLDIDIIGYNDEIIEEEYLTIPHPRLQDRNFVLFPLNEIAPHWIHPVLKESIEKLLEKSVDKGKIIAAYK